MTLMYDSTMKLGLGGPDDCPKPIKANTLADLAVGNFGNFRTSMGPLDEGVGPQGIDNA